MTVAFCETMFPLKTAIPFDSKFLHLISLFTVPFPFTITSSKVPPFEDATPFMTRFPTFARLL
ncbi:hypothetical protein B4100_0640 [Heyndrickxia coagulans]|nr:hypothetical protein B4100_0640 [Heyndrickxia coagulans]